MKLTHELRPGIKIKKSHKDENGIRVIDEAELLEISLCRKQKQ